MSLRDAWEAEARNWVAWARRPGHDSYWQSRDPDAEFVIRDSYFEPRRYADTVERDGLRMTFTSIHRPLEAYVSAFASSGLLVERLAEIPDTTAPAGDRWQRIPLFLHLRALKP